MRKITINLGIIISLILSSASIFAYENGSVSSRIKKLDQKISVYNKDPTLLIKRGKLFLEIKLFEQAITDFHGAIEIDPTYSKGVYLLGTAYMKVDEFEKAKTVLSTYLNLKPRNILGLEAYAQTLLKLKDYAIAEKYYDQAIAYSRTTSPEVYRERAQAQILIEPIPLRRLEKGLESGIRKHGPSMPFFELLVDANIKAENGSRALFWVDQMPEDIRISTVWLIKRAQIHEYQDDGLMAIQLYQQLLRKIDRLPREQQKTAEILDARRTSRKEIHRLKRQF